MDTIRVKQILFTTLITLSYHCSSSKVNTSQVRQELSGIIEEKPFINKIGKEAGIDYYFTTSKKSYLISQSRSEISVEELQQFVGKKVMAEVEIANGAEQKTEVVGGLEVQPQSRILEYIIIFKFK